MNGFKVIFITMVCLLAGVTRLLADQELWAWGNNNFGQLGDSTKMGRWVPVRVHKFAPGDVITMDGGPRHSLAIRASDSTVWAWGHNDYGQLGNGTTTESLEPCSTHLPEGFIEVVGAGVNAPCYSLALRADGTVWAWGYNGEGQFGNNTKNNSSLPCSTWIDNVVAIAGGISHALAIKSDSTVWAWGRNEYGALGDSSVWGDSTWFESLKPVQVHNLTNAIEIAAGSEYSAALKDDGTVWSWGDNAYGTLGIDTMGAGTRVRFPCSTHIFDVIAIDVFFLHTISAKSDGTVWSWGCGIFGQMGNNSDTTCDKPVQAHILTNATAVTAGHGHSLAIEDSIAWAWGLNNGGQLGNNSTVTQKEPVQVHNLINVTAIGAGREHSFAIGDTFPAAIAIGGKKITDPISLAVAPTVGRNSFCIKYSIPKSGFVRLKLYDITGSVKNVLFEKDLRCGSYSSTLDLSDVSSGIYFLRLEVGNKYAVKKFEVVKI